MKKTFKFTTFAVISAVTLLAACGETTNNNTNKAAVQSDNKDTTKAEQQTKGEQLAAVISKTNWQGTRVYDADNNDLTKENEGFIGLAKYDAENGQYEFFDAKTGKTRGDEGTYFITNDGEKRILISKTKEYQAVVDITQLDEDMFTYKRLGKDASGKEVEVFVEHIPYDEKDLAFTNEQEALKTTTGTIDKKENGDLILDETLWQGTKVLDENNEDVTAYNGGFLSIAKFEAATSQYEFFDIETGETKGDFGYFDVLNNNKIRAHVSIGENKYGAVLELTEINDKKFTYKRVGKDANDKEITIFVEHEPYTGDFKPSFTSFK